jgi:hypothetical protein
MTVIVIVIRTLLAVQAVRIAELDVEYTCLKTAMHTKMVELQNQLLMTSGPIPMTGVKLLPALSQVRGRQGMGGARNCYLLSLLAVWIVCHSSTALLPQD